MRYLYLLVACLLFAGCSKSDKQEGPIEPSKPSWTFMYLAGDSTCAPKSASDRPKYGWGEKLRPYLGKCSVDNKAVGGKSSKTYISDGYWSKLTQCLKEGDVVLIQFGHNDESTNSSDDRGTTPEQYYNYLLKMIKEVKGKKAMPVVLTPICRHQFSNGVPVYSHKTYPQKAKDVAAAESVVLLDILTAVLLEQSNGLELVGNFLRVVAAVCILRDAAVRVGNDHVQREVIAFVDHEGGDAVAFKVIHDLGELCLLLARAIKDEGYRHDDQCDHDQVEQYCFDVFLHSILHRG